MLPVVSKIVGHVKGIVGGFFLLVIGLVVLLGLTLGFAACGAWMGYEGGRLLADYVRARHWVEVAAHIEAVDLACSCDGDGCAARAICTYRYAFDGREYQGKRVGLSRGADNIDSWQKATYTRLKQAFEEGRPVTCFVDPAQPTRAVLDRQLRYPLLVFQTAFALVFGLVGLSFTIVCLLGVILDEPRERRLKKAYPNQPWKHKPDWAAGILPSRLRRRAAWLWFVTIYWFLVSLPTTVFLPTGLRQPDKLWAVGGAVYLLIGTILLMVAIRWRSLARRFDASRLELETNPAEVGGDFRARLVLAGDVASLERVSITLRSRHHLSQGEESDVKRTLWEQTTEFEVPRSRCDPGEVALPVHFQIPATCRPTDESSYRDRVTWHLTVKACSSRTKLKLKFEVPVIEAAGEPTSEGAVGPSDKVYLRPSG
ncbi:MAG: DUF3592 domain-containing protein [Phycisphaerae bacterium]|nr:DUF3592 domain-containing protein [Phycisphaerae bacterium]